MGADDTQPIELVEQPTRIQPVPPSHAPQVIVRRSRTDQVLLVLLTVALLTVLAAVCRDQIVEAFGWVLTWLSLGCWVIAVYAAVLVGHLA